jgi:acetolactate decarboxylase
VNSLRPRADKAIQQFSFVDALVAGLYEGAFSAATVASHGSLGVGCGDALDGELVLIDDELWVCRADGVTRVDADARIPFAEVAHFEPTLTHEITAPITEAEFEALVDGLVPSHNLFYALRLDGEFDRVTVREAVRQQRPFRGLADAVKDQHESQILETTGTLLGFKGPDVFQGLSVADYHLHYLSGDRTEGGHSMDFVLRRGTLRMEAYAAFTLRLPETESYLAAELDDMNADAAIRAAESQ